MHITCYVYTATSAANVNSDAAGEPANATYANFTSDRIFHSPTDLNWIIARVLVFNDSDTATALTFSGNITLAPYNTASELQSLCMTC